MSDLSIFTDLVSVHDIRSLIENTAGYRLYMDEPFTDENPGIFKIIFGAPSGNVYSLYHDVLDEKTPITIYQCEPVPKLVIDFKEIKLVKEISII